MSETLSAVLREAAVVFACVTLAIAFMRGDLDGSPAKPVFFVCAALSVCSGIAMAVEIWP